jgi:YVTN family beta-propeller protein
LYSANFVGSTVSVIDTTNDTVVATISSPQARTPLSATLSPDGKTLYTANFNSSNVSVIDTTTNAVTSLVAVGSGPAATVVSPDGSRLYVGNQDSNNVSVVNTTGATAVDFGGVAATS